MKRTHFKLKHNLGELEFSFSFCFLFTGISLKTHLAFFVDVEYKLCLKQTFAKVPFVKERRKLCPFSLHHLSCASIKVITSNKTSNRNHRKISISEYDYDGEYTLPSSRPPAIREPPGAFSGGPRLQLLLLLLRPAMLVSLFHVRLR